MSAETPPIRPDARRELKPNAAVDAERRAHPELAKAADAAARLVGARAEALTEADRVDPDMAALWDGLEALRGDPDIEAALNEARAMKPADAVAANDSSDAPAERGGFGRRAWIAAACLVLTVGVGAVLVSRDAGPEQQRFASERGERREITLADGSVLTLDTASVVTVRLTERERAVVLEQGRARFDVAHEANRPFAVEAGPAQVQALGTTFDVRLDAGAASVTLYEGRVALAPLEETWFGRTRTGEAVTLAPGEQASVSAAGALAAPAPVDPDAQGAWIDGRLVFRDAPLADVIAEVNRYVDRPIRIGDPSLADIRLRASFEAGDADAVVEALTLGFPIQARKTSGGVTVLSRADGAR